MSDKIYDIKRLDWDSLNYNMEIYQLSFFGDIVEKDWNLIENTLQVADLVYIKNSSRYRNNSLIISMFTNATLYDTNISFLLKDMDSTDIYFNKKNIVITNNPMHELNHLLDFQSSRFFVDNRLCKVGGENIYSDWIRNSTHDADKKFIIFTDNNVPLGFILFSKKSNIYVVELISVSRKNRGEGIGKKMLAILVNLASNDNITEIRVGTQISNISAINFYIRNKFIVGETTDIYHWWKDKI